MFAVVAIAGFQEKVKEGDTIRVPHLDVEEGKPVTFEQVLLLGGKGDDVTLGTPHVSGASVEAKVISHGRADKIKVLKFRHRKRYLHTKGHRQLFTEVTITKIHAGK